MNYKKILCMCLAGVGDALTFSPFIEELKRAKPGINIDVLVMFRAAESIYKNHPSVTEVFYSDFVNQNAFKSFSDVIKLRRKKYDAVVAALPSNRWEYNVIQMMIGGRRIGHQYNHFNKINLNFLKQDWIMEDESLHVVENNLKLLKFFEVPYPENPPKLSMRLSDEDHTAANLWLENKVKKDKILVGFHPGTAVFKNHINRRWAPENFAKLAKDLVEKLDATVLIFGGPEEKELREKICSCANNLEQIISVDGTSLRQSAALIQKCNVMVSNDSSLMHISAAVQTPIVALFGYTNPVFVHPWKVKHKIVSKNLPCSPCFFYSPKAAQCYAKKNYECVKSITVEEVFEAVKELMQN